MTATLLIAKDRFSRVLGDGRGTGQPNSADVAMVDLEEFRGRFTDGYTDEDISGVLPVISQRLGLRLVCVWDYIDDMGCGGNSVISVALEDGDFAAPPEGLEALLNGLVDADRFVDPATAGTEGGYADWPKAESFDDFNFFGVDEQ